MKTTLTRERDLDRTYGRHTYQPRRSPPIENLMNINIPDYTVALAMRDAIRKELGHVWPSRKTEYFRHEIRRLLSALRAIEAA